MHMCIVHVCVCVSVGVCLCRCQCLFLWLCLRVYTYVHLQFSNARWQPSVLTKFKQEAVRVRVLVVAELLVVIVHVVAFSSLAHDFANNTLSAETDKPAKL